MAQIREGFSNGNQLAVALTLHGLFSHVPQTRPATSRPRGNHSPGRAWSHPACNAASLTEDLDCRKQQSGNGELGKQHLVHGGADLAAQLGGHSFHFAAQFVHLTP